MPEYSVISADSHVVEHHNLWQERVAPEYRGRAPRLVHEPDTDRLVCDDALLPPVGLLAGCARGDDEVRQEGRWDDDVFPSGYDPNLRLADIAKDGVDAEVLFPTIAMQLYPIEDTEFRWELFRAYNSWLAEDFCAAHPDRFFGIAMISHDDVEPAVAEIIRAKELGLVGVMVPLFSGEDAMYQDPRFDPIWKTAIECGLPINLHAATSRDKKTRLDFSKPVTEAEIPKKPTISSVQVQQTLLGLIYSGFFDRFPDLMVVSAENDAGWAGHLLEASDYQWRRGRRLARARGRFPIDCEYEPSHYFHKNVRLTFMRDRTAVLAEEIIGEHVLMWGNDFPHHVSTWPNSQKVLATHFDDQAEEKRHRIVCGNVRELYGI